MRPSQRMIDDALRFMRAPASRDEELVGVVRAAFERLEEAVRPRSVWGRFPVSPVDGGILVAGVEVRSVDLARLMSRSRECILMAVTLGPEVDRQILLAQKRGMLEGMALDACASVRADAFCDEVEAGLPLQDGEGLTMRFSPGYGDAPLSASEEIIALLDATRRIGLSLTRSLMMTPVKSITALLGVTRQGEEGRHAAERCGARGCALCGADCPYRRPA